MLLLKKEVSPCIYFMYKLHTRIILPTALPQLRTFAVMQCFRVFVVVVAVLMRYGLTGLDRMSQD